jgi:hypothetical protein
MEVTLSAHTVAVYTTKYSDVEKSYCSLKAMNAVPMPITQSRRMADTATNPGMLFRSLTDGRMQFLIERPTKCTTPSTYVNTNRTPIIMKSDVNSLEDAVWMAGLSYPGRKCKAGDDSCPS